MTQPHPAWDADYHQMTSTEYAQLLQQRRWQLDADHTAGTLTDPERAYLREHVAAVDPQALREQVTHWTPTTADRQTATAAGESAAVPEQLGKAAPLPHEIAERAAQLYRTGQYPDYTRAHHVAAQQTTAEAYRQAGPTNDWHAPVAPPPAEPPHTTPAQAGHVGTRQREHVEDRVLAAAAQLDPADDSLPARQLRETAASIRDHRTSPTTTDAGTAADTPAARAGGWPAESLDRVVDTMREALDGRQQMPPFRPADQATEAEQRLGWVSAPTTDTPPQRVRRSTDLAVAALQVRDCLDRITPRPAADRDHDQAADSTTADRAEPQAAADDH